MCFFCYLSFRFFRGASTKFSSVSGAETARLTFRGHSGFQGRSHFRLYGITRIEFRGDLNRDFSRVVSRNKHHLIRTTHIRLSVCVVLIGRVSPTVIWRGLVTVPIL